MSSPIKVNVILSLNYNSVMKFIFSIAQFNILPGDVEANYKKALSSIDRASADNSSMLVLPELFLTGYESRKTQIPLYSTHEFISGLKQYAKQKQIYIAGTYSAEFQGHFYNTFFLFSNEGMLKLTYQKIHLFSPMGETKVFQPGKLLKSVQCHLGHIGAAICYDLRFSEMFVNLRAKGVNIFVIPAEWPHDRIAHWETLCKARAIEMQAFVIASNCVGASDKFVFGGQSMIIDPLGNILCKGNSVEEGVFSAEIDISLSDLIRSKFPFFSDRKVRIYKKS